METKLEKVKQYLNDLKEIDAILTVQSMGYDTFYWRCEEQLCIEDYGDGFAMPIDVIMAYPDWKRVDTAIIDFNEYIISHLNRIGYLRVLSRKPSIPCVNTKWGWWNEIAQAQCAVVANLFAGCDTYDMPETLEGNLARNSLSSSLRGRISVLHTMILKWQSEEIQAMQTLLSRLSKKGETNAV